MAKELKFETKHEDIDIRDYDDPLDFLDDKIAENESFWGVDLNERKKQRLDKIFALCKEVSEKERGVRCKKLDFGHENRHATVQLRFPSVYVIENRATFSLLEQLFELSDDFCMAVTENRDQIWFSYSVMDMWDTVGTYYDRPHEKK